MKSTPIQTGCVHLSHGESFNAIFGCPSEVLKTILSQGHAMPDTIVLPDTFHHHGVSLIALEFPFYHFLFIQNALAEGRCFRVIGTREGCERVAEMLRVTLLGPTDAEMKRWKINKRVREMLRAELDYLALKHPDGRVRQVSGDLIEFVHYDAGDTAVLCDKEGEELWVRRLGDDHFALLKSPDAKKPAATLEIPLEGDVRPAYTLDPSPAPLLPSNFSVTIVGASNGFDPKYPTTCYLLWLNGVGLLWDAPPFAREQLKARGVPKEAIAGIILTHVHDDHCSFLEFLLDDQRPTVISTREVFECLLIKMGAILGERPDQVREYMDFVEIRPGRPTKLYGAEFNFFYGFHSIPCFGAEVSVQDKDGKPHTIYLSGDTLHFKGVDEALEKGVITKERAGELKGFVDKDYELLVLDGGCGAIHMCPTDYVEVNHKIVVTHRSSLDTDHGENMVVGMPGNTWEIVPSEPVHPFHAQAIFEALKLFEIKDRTWVDVLLYRGRVCEAAPGEVIVKEGTAGDTFYVVLSGGLDVKSSGESVASLGRGDFFGEIAVLTGVERTATVEASGPCCLFELPGDLFMDFVEANDLREEFARLWRDRRYIREVELFAGLDASATHRITMESEARSYKKGEKIVGEKDAEAGHNIFIVKKGGVRLYEKGKLLKDGRDKALVLRPGRFFGKHVVVDSKTLNRYSAVADVKTDVLVLNVAKLKELQREMPVIRHRIRLTMDEEAFSANGNGTRPRAITAKGGRTTAR